MVWLATSREGANPGRLSQAWRASSLIREVLLDPVGEHFIFIGNPQQLPTHRLSGHLFGRAARELGPRSVLVGG